MITVPKANSESVPYVDSDGTVSPRRSHINSRRHISAVFRDFREMFLSASQ
jgi:hypothetical protein